ncbi:MAG TPA: aminotransferase class V-fold PLP-dependent enzyme [Streptosporangiaceae bacterium]|jgi:isopenicillin-N epimerase
MASAVAAGAVPAGRQAADDSLPDRSAWSLDPALAYLNHGGFGATPVRVLAEQQRWRHELERNPTVFLTRQLPDLLAGVRRQLATFLHADEDGLVFVANATAGTQTVISQAGLAPGDEVLATDHGYPAVLMQLRRAVEATGAALRLVPLPLPAGGAGELAAAVLAQLSGRTRLLVVDHVASCSGLVFPVEAIAAGCRERGVPVLVDGAHAAGMLPVDVGRIGADFWVGNLHKWVCAPKAAGVLYAAPRWRGGLQPLVASHGLAEGYQQAFDWTGTHDPTALLAVPAALDFFAAAGWSAVRARNNVLAGQGAELVAARIGAAVPDVGGLAAAMRLVRLPEPLLPEDARALERRLYAEHGVVVPVTAHSGSSWLRVSAQLYNTLRDYERLADALIELQSGRPAAPATARP